MGLRDEGLLLTGHALAQRREHSADAPFIFPAGSFLATSRQRVVLVGTRDYGVLKQHKACCTTTWQAWMEAVDLVPGAHLCMMASTTAGGG